MSAVATESVDIPFSIAGREFRSRLMVGTGKYASNQQMVDAINASGAEVVTVAVRRVDLSRRDDANILVFEQRRGFRQVRRRNQRLYPLCRSQTESRFAE